MRENITLSSGRTVSHKAQTIAGKETGVTEAFILSYYVISGIKIEKHSEMTNEEWAEYVQIIQSH